MARGKGGLQVVRASGPDPDPGIEIESAPASEAELEEAIIAVVDAPPAPEPPDDVMVDEDPFDDLAGRREVFGPSQDPRIRTVEIVRERIEAMLQPVDASGDWTGVLVVTRADLSEALKAPLPSGAPTTAAVKTPAYVYVDAVCPRCYVAGEILVVIKPELTVTADHQAVLKVKAKAAGLPHVCGQKRLGDTVTFAPAGPRGQVGLGAPAAVDEGTQGEPGGSPADDDGLVPELGPGDVVRPTGATPVLTRQGLAKLAAAGGQGADESADLNLGWCPFPGCALAADHPGGHAVAAADADDDLLPF